MTDLVKLNIVDGEVVDDTCERCGKPGQWIEDPYEADVNNAIVMVCLCAECEQERVWDI